MTGVSRAQVHPDIRLEGIEKTFGAGDKAVVALDRTDLEIPSGQFLVLLGPSGCGKTTLLRMVAGLIEPTEGTTRIGDRSLWQDNKRDAEALQELGVVFQEANLFPWMKVAENISLPLKLRGVGAKERLARASELCALVGISGFENSWPRQLSGGMRQRAALARALSQQPHLLLMDEPFGALDALTRDQLNLELQRIWLDRKCTVIFVTHSITEAVFLADRVLLLSPRPGRIDTVIDVDFPRPRPISVQETPEFQAIVRQLRSRLEQIG